MNRNAQQEWIEPTERNRRGSENEKIWWITNKYKNGCERFVRIHTVECGMSPPPSSSSLSSSLVGNQMCSDVKSIAMPMCMTSMCQRVSVCLYMCFRFIGRTPFAPTHTSQRSTEIYWHTQYTHLHRHTRAHWAHATIRKTEEPTHDVGRRKKGHTTYDKLYVETKILFKRNVKNWNTIVCDLSWDGFGSNSLPEYVCVCVGVVD